VNDSRYRAVFEVAPDGLAISTLDGVIAEVNTAFCLMHGYTREELIGRQMGTLVQPGVQPARSETAFRAESVHIRGDGTAFPVEVSRTHFSYLGQPHALDVVRRADQRLRELEALYRADGEIYRSLRLGDVLESLVDVAADVLEADKTSITVWDANHERLVPGAARGFSAESLARMAYAPGQGITGHVAASGQPIVVQDTHTDERVARQVADAEGIRSLLHVPIMVGEEIFGVFGVAYDVPRTIGDDQQRLVLALAQRAALAIQNARLYEQAQHAATLEERQRLARELHDAVTQTLFSTALIAEVLPELWELDPAAARTSLEELRRLTRGALAEMRTLLVELRPGALVELPLPELLRQLAEAIVGRTRLDISVDADGEPTTAPSADVKVAMYRIAQEALNNVVKHAQARHANVSLHYAPSGRPTLRIEDDGHGFDLSSIPAGHLGVGIMRERAEAVGATLVIESQPGRGTRVQVVWCPAEGSAT
jgi:PAS domain S-box-containing protein